MNVWHLFDLQSDARLVIKIQMHHQDTKLGTIYYDKLGGEA